MGRLLFNAIVLGSVVWGGLVPARAVPRRNRNGAA
jgi:hypothetical protein